MRVLSIEAIDQPTQHCHYARKHLLAWTNTIGGNQSFSDRCIEAKTRDFLIGLVIVVVLVPPGQESNPARRRNRCGM